MIAPEIKIIGMDDLRRRLARLDKPSREAAINKGLVAGAQVIETQAKFLINNSTPTGRVYTRRGISHQASAPGQPPAGDLGNLASSIFVFPGHMEAAVGPTADYGPHLEFGTPRMRARPFMRPATFNNMRQIEAAIRATIEPLLTGGI